MNTEIYYSKLASPIGELTLISNGKALTGLFMRSHSVRTSAWTHSDQMLKPARTQLKAYFDGELRDFDLPLAGEGTEFQKTVWKALCEIPYGETISYGELARRIKLPHAARAVGSANGSNPISIVVPCHRVIGANGTLTGYGGGLPRKKWLLEQESGVRRLI